MSRYRKKLYSKDNQNISPVRRLKDGREKIPQAKLRILKQEQTPQVIEWLESADYWINFRSNGIENRRPLPKEEIRIRKLEAGKILRDFNIYHSDDGLGIIDFT